MAFGLRTGDDAWHSASIAMCLWPCIYGIEGNLRNTIPSRVCLENIVQKPRVCLPTIFGRQKGPGELELVSIALDKSVLIHPVLILQKILYLQAWTGSCDLTAVPPSSSSPSLHSSTLDPSASGNAIRGTGLCYLMSSLSWEPQASDIVCGPPTFFLMAIAIMARRV